MRGVLNRVFGLMHVLSMIVLMFPAQTMALKQEQGEEVPALVSLPGGSVLGESSDVTDDSTSDGIIMQEESITATDTAEDEGAHEDDTASEGLDGIATLFADTLTYGNLQYTVSGDNITITGCDDGVTSLTIPAQIDGKNVTTINDNAFSGRSSLTSLTIPESVTYLGSYMIRGTGITSITIPSTVTDSGGYYSSTNGALAGCTALNEVIFAQGTTKIPAYICASNSQNSYIKSVTIPDSVQEIGAYAFYKCTSLTGTIDIPAATKFVGGSAFAGCTSVTSVTTHQNNTIEWTGSIDSSAFSDCTSLTSVEIAGSIKTVGDYVFHGCTNLTTVTLHQGITSLGDQLFNNCNSLTTLTIPESVTYLGSYLIRGTGITSITIPSTVTDSGGYYSSTNGALAGCTALNEVIFAQGTTKIPAYICASNSQNSYIERVYIPPSVAEIGDNAFYKCDRITIYCKDESYAKQYAVDNNIPFILGNFEYGRPTNPVVTTGSIQSVTMSRGGKAYNLLTTRQSFEKGSEESVFVTVVVDWRGAPAGRILLSQSASKYQQSNDGNFGSMTPGKYFDTGKAIYVIAVDGNGNTLESKRVFLQVTEPVTQGNIDPVWDSQFKLFDAITFTVGEDKPVFGEQNFNIDLGLINEQVEINKEDGTFKIALGVNFEKDDNGKFGTKDFANLKEGVKEFQKNILTGSTVVAIQSGLHKKGLDGNWTNLKIKSGWEPSASVCGYVEGKYENGQYIPTEGGIVVAAEMKYTYQGQVFVWVVPVYYSIGGGGSVEVSLGVKGMVPGTGMKPMFAGNLTIAPFAEIGGGIGVVYLGQVGARGKATLSINIALDHNYQKVDLTGQAYFEIKALTFTLYEREFASGTWNIFETGRASTASLQSTPQDVYAVIDMNVPATPEDRGYANQPTRWRGEELSTSLQAADYTNKELRVLQTNAYPDAKPQIMDVDGTKVMVWVSDNTSRTAMNKSMLVYSVYIDEYDTWSSPRAIMDNGRGDYYPVAKDGYVVWQKASQEFDPTATVADVSQSMEIYIAKFNGTAFDTPSRLTNNDIMDAQPQIAVNGNSVTVVWTQNTENNILGYTGKNTIYQMTYDGSSWSSVASLVSDLNTVAHLNVGYMGNAPVVAYVLDGDNDLNTIGDREIYLIRNGSAERFTNNDVIDSNPVFETINGVPALFWYSDNNIYYVTDLDSPVLNTVSTDGIYQLTDDYSIMSNGNSTTILWTVVQDGVSEVYGALYDGSQWSKDVEITQTGQAARYPNGIIEEDGKLLICFNRIQNVQDGDYYKDGQADLCVIRVTPSYDLAISNVFIGDGLAPNTEVPVYVTLTNSGELPLASSYVNIMDVDDSQNAHLDYNQVLQPGESVDLEVGYQTGSAVTAGNIRVQAGTSAGAEYNESNNTASVAIGLSDMKVIEVTDNQDGDMHQVTVSVKNSGYTAAMNVKVAVSDNLENVIAEQTIETVVAQGTENVSFDINANNLATENSFIALTADVSSDTEDANIGNNSRVFTIAKGSQSPSPTNYDYNINTISADSSVIRVGVTANSDRNAQLWVVAYTSTGKFMGATAVDVTPESVTAGPIELTLDMDGVAYVSAFVLDDGTMGPLCQKKTQSI